MSNAKDDRWPDILYGTAWKKAATPELTRQAIAAGYRGIDTANQPRHYDEAGVGGGIAAALEASELSRADLFLQTKFTPLESHGAVVPYNREAPIEDQIEQSLQSSLEHLGTTWLDCYLLHGPYDPRRMSSADWRAWQTLEMIQQRGDVRRIGISNIGPGHLRDLLEHAAVPPAAVQNRCFAQSGWDREVRTLCIENGIVYQGFSLLTANLFVLQDPWIAGLAERHKATVAQIVFAFARQAGMVPLTGTTDSQHMADDLAALSIPLSGEEVAAIAGIAD